MTHRRAVLTMLFVTLLWSMAAVVTRQLESARGFEITFWRSAFMWLSRTLYLGISGGFSVVVQIGQGGRALWVSGLMWSVMFTCFMLALTLTTAANVLITMSIAPLITALLARLMLGQHVPRRTWTAILLAGCGIAWMYAAGFDGDPKQLAGTAVAMCVPLAGAINWNLSQRTAARIDLVPALLIGATISSLLTLLLTWPLQASTHDIAWLAMLGVFQLTIPCILAVHVARVLPAPEMSLLVLLESVFGIAWVWLASSEQPTAAVVLGGSLVLVTLAVNQWLGLREQRLVPVRLPVGLGVFEPRSPAQPK
ncbi:MAG: DMT family transporter [Rhizobacter sp.]|nr:DMT family transporter [Rhizobacter sp.]